MPSTSEKQHNFMEMVAHDKGAAKRVGVPQKVGKDFVKADAGKAPAKKKPASPEMLKAQAAALRKPKAAPEPDGDEGAGY